jgi:mannose-6-phosphate isomerase
MPVLCGEPVAPHLFVYRTPATEFELSRLEWPEGHGGRPVRADHCGPQILLCTAGSVRLANPDGPELCLHRGQSVWLPATDPAVLVAPAGDGPAQMFRATAGTGD